MIFKKFQNLSKNIWKDIPTAKLFKLSYGEETITDVMLLALARQNCYNLRIIQTPKADEADQGTDWEWYIGSAEFGWLRFIIQAKKLSQTTFAYNSLLYPLKKDLSIPYQHIALRKYANQTGAIPLYTFYNYHHNPTINEWQCNLDYKIKQLGWSFTPLRNVENTLTPIKKNRKKGYNTFQKIHSYKETLPIRCLFRCPLFKMLFLDNSLINNPGIFLGEPFQKVARLPQQFLSSNKIQVLEELPQDFYPTNLALYPNKIAIFDITDELVST